MPSKNPAQRLADIIDNVDAIRRFTSELDLPAFRGDRKTVYAVVRALEIISEASRRLPDDLLHVHVVALAHRAQRTISSYASAR